MKMTMSSEPRPSAAKPAAYAALAPSNSLAVTVWREPSSPTKTNSRASGVARERSSNGVSNERPASGFMGRSRRG